MYVRMCIYTRGQQESYYSEDFIVKDTMVDNHLETLGYSLEKVSAYLFLLCLCMCACTV